MASVELEAKRCYNYVLTVAPHLPDLAIQRAIWNIYKVEVGGYNRVQDTKPVKKSIGTFCRDKLREIMRGI